MKTSLLRTTLAALCLAGLALSTASAGLIIDEVAVGNPGNSNDASTGSRFGGVAYSYYIGKNDVTNAQYATFLNTVDPTGQNSLSIYNSQMQLSGISLTTGAANGSKYVLIEGNENHPVTHVTYSDTMRFANWLNNGQGSGGTETGAYNVTLGLLAQRNPTATVFLPTESEWYKAAYYDPTISHYYLYGTRSDTQPSSSDPTSQPNSANSNNLGRGLTDVGAYTNSASYYGAFDMSGNVYQFTEGERTSNGSTLRGGYFGEVGSGISKLNVPMHLTQPTTACSG